MKETLEISKIELQKIDPADWKITKLSDFYLPRLLKKANEIGLQGKKIKEIIKCEDNHNNMVYLDFICDK